MKNILLKLAIVCFVFIQASIHPKGCCDKYTYEDLVDTCYNHIKFHEGFRSNVYSDSNGYKYIGYGHHLNCNEHYTNITKKQAELLLEKDFNKIKKKVSELSPNLSSNRLLAITLFAYNNGTGFYMGSSLRKLVDSGKSIKNCILSYANYVRNGKYITSKRLQERRKFELWLYNL